MPQDLSWYDGRLIDPSRSSQGQSSQSQSSQGQQSDLTLPSAALPASVPLDNAALRFGASLFTTLRIYGGDLQHPLTQWPQHCERLARSQQQFGWTEPDWQAIHSGCQQLKNRHPILRITLFPEGQEWITGRGLPPQLSQQQRQGVIGWVAPPNYCRSFPAHKTGNYLACWLARQQAQRQGAQEAILVGPDASWLETSSGNLWGWRSGYWWTPIPQSPQGESLCLPGIMRDYLIKLITASGQAVHTQPWKANEVNRFEALAYSNCVVGFLPIHTVLRETTKLEYNPQHASLVALKQQLSQAGGSSFMKMG